ncbi:MAG: replication protein C [Rhodobacteraceae bacterium]|nr:replication protein C [Paracoccaceae bacterium]
MAFTQISAPDGLRTGELLSADNSIPERHIVIETLRTAAPRLGLSASVISTLDAMLSCLAPKRNHHTVFASNATLTFRRNGISDRTIRRHAAILQDAGLLERRDSPNRKRYTKRNPVEQTALRFGFDLTPLFKRLNHIAALAAEVLSEREQINYMRTKIRAAAQERLRQDPDNPSALNVLRLLRRKLTLQDCEDIFAHMGPNDLKAEGSTQDEPSETSKMATSNGQNVRHHHNSNKELIEKEERPLKKETPSHCQETPLSVQELLNACPEAAKFALEKVVSAEDVISHARTLAPMIGITNQTYETAIQRLGPFRTAATLWAIMQFHSKIKSVGAYFRSITTGAKSMDFSPEKLVRRLMKGQSIAA